MTTIACRHSDKRRNVDLAAVSNAQFFPCLKSRAASSIDELIEPLIVGRADERLEIVPEIHRVLSAHVGVECLPVCEDLDEVKWFVVGDWLMMANV